VELVEHQFSLTHIPGTDPMHTAFRGRRSLRRPLLTLAAVGALTGPGLNAQTVYSTFGPGDSYRAGINCCDQYIVQYSQWIAASFTYAGQSGLELERIRFAAYFGSGGASSPTASFWAGSDIGSATLIESWVLTGYAPNVDQIFSLSSGTGNPFVTGETYWLRLATGSDGSTGAWRWNDQGLLGVSASYDHGASWDSYPDIQGVAWDVSAASTTTPEPGAMVLLATGLAGLVGAGLVTRRRRVGPPAGTAT
jgi:hypothetical protein